VAGGIALTTGAIMVKSLVRRSRALSKITPKHVIDHSIKVSRVSPPEVKPAKPKAKVNPPVPPEDFMGLTPKEMTRLCEYLGYSPKEMDILKQAMREKNLNAEQIEGLRVAMQQRRFSSTLKQPATSSPPPPSRPGFWGRLFDSFMDGLEADLEKSSQNSHSTGRPSHSPSSQHPVSDPMTGMLQAADMPILFGAQPTPNRREPVYHSYPRRLIGYVNYLSRDRIHYEDQNGYLVAIRYTHRSELLNRNGSLWR
jgi:hypothetical protein